MAQTTHPPTFLSQCREQGKPVHSSERILLLASKSAHKMPILDCITQGNHYSQDKDSDGRKFKKFFLSRPQIGLCINVHFQTRLLKEESQSLAACELGRICKGHSLSKLTYKCLIGSSIPRRILLHDFFQSSEDAKLRRPVRKSIQPLRTTLWIVTLHITSSGNIHKIFHVSKGLINGQDELCN